MRKMISTLSVFALICAMAVSAFAKIEGEVTKIDKKAYDSFPAVKESANNKTVFITAGMDLVSDSKAGWVLNVTENLSGMITVAYKIGNEYFTVFFEIEGEGIYWIGEGSGKNGVNHAKVAAFVPTFIEDDPIVDDVVVNLGFIGYYVYDGKVMSTSIHWQLLEEEGDMIDWVAVDAAYAEWVAQGGLVPDRETGWLTSGYASFTFEDNAALGFGDFNIGQLEDYYKAYYVDPGYVLDEADDCDCGCCDECGFCGECDDCDDDPVAPPTVNKGCENCQGDKYKCDGSGRLANGQRCAQGEDN